MESPTDSSHRRNRAIRWAVLTSLVSKFGTAVLQLISIPIAIRVLGLEVFGIYSTISMGIFMVMLLQIGVGPALAHGISRALARDDREAQRHYYTTALYVILGLAAGGGLLVASILTFIPVPVLFGQQYAVHADLMLPAMWLGLVIVLLQFVLSHTERTREGYLEVGINNAWGAFGNFLGAIALAAGISFFPSIEYLLLCIFGSNVIAKLGNTIHLLIRRPYLIPIPSLFRRHISKSLLTDGVAFSVSAYASGIVEINLCTLIIGHLSGPAPVGIYNILMQLSSLLVGCIVMITNPTWPAIVDALSRRDLAWIRRAAVRLRRFGLAYGVAVMLGLTVLGPMLIPLWLGPEVEIPRLTLFAFSCFFLIGSWNHINHTLLIGMGKVKPVAGYVLFEASVILIPGVLGLVNFGLPGLLFGLAITKLLINGTIFPRMFRRSLEECEDQRRGPAGEGMPSESLAS